MASSYSLPTISQAPQQPQALQTSLLGKVIGQNEPVPTAASGMSSATQGSPAAPAKVSVNPNTEPNQNPLAADLLGKITGKNPPKAAGTNPSVNSLSTVGFSTLPTI